MPILPKEAKTLKSQIAKLSSNGGIVIYLYHDFDQAETYHYHSIDEYGKEFTAEDICLIVAERLQIGSLAFPLFALKKSDSDIWLPPNAIVKCLLKESQTFEFRIRFIPPESRINTLGALDRNAFSYLFQQVRNDFLNDRIQYRDQAIGQEHLLGMGVIDVLRFGKERCYDLVHLQKLDPHSFIPKRTKDSFKRIWNKQRLRLNFRPHLEKEYDKYSNDTDLNIKLTYIDGILSYAEHYGMETLKTEENDTNITITVKPYDKNFPGLSIFTKNSIGSGQEHFHSLIEDLMDVSISNDRPGFVQINRKTGMPRVIYFQDSERALSFVSLLDGYYRLQVDYHHHLCLDVKSPLMMRLHQIRCHGPVSKDWSAQRLVQRFTAGRDFNFLLKQKEKELGHYVLVYLPINSQNHQVMFWPIIKLSDGNYQLSGASGTEPVYATMKELIESYKNRDDRKAIHLNKCVPPTNPIDNKIYLCKDVFMPGNDDDVIGGKVKQQRAPVCLVSVIQCGELLGHGNFTEIFNSFWEKDGEERTSIEVVAKQLKLNLSQYQESFSRGIHEVVFWCHPTIATIHAICLSSPFTVLMEKASLGMLDKYLCEPQMELKVYHLVIAAEQIAQALFYLQEERGEVHGNIRCRNILVLRHEPKGSLLVKLADPGMIHFYNKCSIDHVLNVDRLPWIAPECYENLKEMSSLSSDRYSFGITLWEMFSVGMRPWQDKTLHQLMKCVTGREQLVQPQCCPDDIFNIMKSCWSLTPESRMKSKEIIRNIRSLLTKEGDIYNEYSEVNWLDRSTNSRISSQSSDLLLGESTSSSSSSSAAAADNSINMRRLKQSLLPTSQRVENHTTRVIQMERDSIDSLHLQTSPLSESASLPWDSQTPLIRQESETASGCSLEPVCRYPPTSPTLSGGSTWSGNTERTELDTNYGTSSVETTIRNDIQNQVDAIQSRPLPRPPNFSDQLPASQLKYDRNQAPLGQGHYGEVYSGTFTMDSGIVVPVAIKCLKSKMYQKFAVEFEKEFLIMVQLQHENVVKIIGQCSPKDRDRPMLLVMEFVEKGCLREYLQKKKISTTSLIRFGREISEGMSYLSSQKIVHRDLAARNVLVTLDEHMKISDFGLSRALSPDRDYYKCDTNKELPAPWCSPESLIHRRFNELSDVWSFGVTLWEIFSFGKMPNLVEIDKLPFALHEGKRLACPEGCPASVYKLMMFQCWQYYPDDRKNFATILLKLKAIELQETSKT